MVICEFEPVLEISSPGWSMPVHQQPSKILTYQASAEEWRKSTTRISKSLRFSRRVDRSDSHENPIDLIGAMNDIQNQLISSTSIAMLSGIIVRTVSEFTSFDRVMVYRFDECKCGAVVAEYLNPLASQDLLVGLHFPSSDLPPWIRKLYKVDRIHVLRDRRLEKASLLYRNLDDYVSFDLTTSCLREVAPDQVQLFSDLDVSSAMTISLVVEGDLWGLITCHSYRSKVVEVSPLMREVCRCIGDCASAQIEREYFPLFQIIFRCQNLFKYLYLT
jgi:light-regulated signal transduction histidine kinase (bacteriophytochrome)